MRYKTCKYCQKSVIAPCYSVGEVRYHGSHLMALQRCRDAVRKIDAAHEAEKAHPVEDTFAAPSKLEAEKAWSDANGGLSDTAKAQIAMEGLKPSAAPTPFEWGLMRENAARGIRSLELRPEDVQAQRAALEAAGLDDLVKIREPAVSKTEGVKFDDGKLRFDLLPPDALAVVAAVMTYGALKYRDRNWELGMDRARLRAARSRHENRRLLGESHDPETGLPHVAHEAACTLMELALLLRNTGTDSNPDAVGCSREQVDAYAKAAVENGRIAAARKGAQHG